ncbi:MAG TPA: DUF2905 domain-containing protein [Bacteroidales bacterium]|nr:DUF2905 domain-containing protein [Bacteroidales bacterium]
MSYLAKTLIILGIFLVAAGLILLLGGNRLNWVGRLPGDIRIERDHFRLYFPITTMILFSILVSLVIWIIRKLF